MTLRRWLQQRGLEHYAGLLEENDIDLERLRTLSDVQLELIGVDSHLARRTMLEALQPPTDALAQTVSSEASWADIANTDEPAGRAVKTRGSEHQATPRHDPRLGQTVFTPPSSKGGLLPEPPSAEPMDCLSATDPAVGETLFTAPSSTTKPWSGPSSTSPTPLAVGDSSVGPTLFTAPPTLSRSTGLPLAPDGLPDVRATLGARYRLLERVGQGAMGAVYRAWDEKTEHECAIKVMLPAKRALPEAREQFRREAKIAMGLSHPHLMRVYHLEDVPLDYLVMEFVDGVTLTELRQRDGRGLKPDDARKYLMQVLEGLSYLHSENLFHRDIKPDNVLVTRDGRVKLADYGVATTIRNQRLEAQVAGTLAYMAPEQLRGDRGLDGRADLYSVGMMAYELLLGYLPFPGDDPGTARAWHLSGERKLDELRSLPWGGVYARALAASPADRFPSAAAMIDALQVGNPTAASEPATASVTASPISKPDQVTDSSRLPGDMHKETATYPEPPEPVSSKNSSQIVPGQDESRRVMPRDPSTYRDGAHAPMSLITSDTIPSPPVGPTEPVAAGAALLWRAPWMSKAALFAAALGVAGLVAWRVMPRCGNGIRELTEDCDDGNLDPGDLCTSSCASNVAFLAAGTFLMGYSASDLDKGMHRVTRSRRPEAYLRMFAEASTPATPVRMGGFRILRTEVSRAAFARFLMDNTEGALEAVERSVESLAWHRNLIARVRSEAQPILNKQWMQRTHGALPMEVPPEWATAFCAWLGGAPPTEAQFEYAARSSGGDGIFPWGDAPLTGAQDDCKRVTGFFILSETPRADFNCGGRMPTPVGATVEGCTPNAVCDLTGNVSELVQPGPVRWRLENDENTGEPRYIARLPGPIRLPNGSEEYHSPCDRLSVEDPFGLRTGLVSDCAEPSEALGATEPNRHYPRAQSALVARGGNFDDSLPVLFQSRARYPHARLNVPLGFRCVLPGVP